MTFRFVTNGAFSLLRSAFIIISIFGWKAAAMGMTSLDMIETFSAGPNRKCAKCFIEFHYQPGFRDIVCTLNSHVHYCQLVR